MTARANHSYVTPIEQKVRTIQTQEIARRLKEVKSDIDVALSAAKDHPIDRNTHLITARENLTQGLLSCASLYSVVVTQLSTVFDRLPYRDRVSRDAVGVALMIVNSLQEATWAAMKD